jgi:methylenetetrahydrofolate reductase (NADPH)
MSEPRASADALAVRAAELLASASIEVAPSEHSNLWAVAEALPADSCVYVAAPGHRPLAETLETVAAVRRAGLDPVPHVVARRFASRTALRDFLAAAVGEHGAHRVMLIGGDAAQAAGPYADAVQLLQDGALARCGLREVGLAGYPEGHPRIAADALAYALARKLALAREQSLGAYVVTQFSFSPLRVNAYCAELGRQAPATPVYVGMAGPTDPLALMRYAQRCGVSASLRAMRTLGSGMVGLATHTDPQEQLMALAHHCEVAGGGNVTGIHLYGFGGALRTARWLRDRLHRAA